MTVEEVKKVRELATKYKRPLKIIADNGHIFYDGGGDYQHLIWNDDGGVFYMFRLPDSTYACKGGPSTVEMVVTDYDCIQNMIMQPQFKDLSGMLTDLGVMAEDIPDVIKKLEGPYATIGLNATQK